MFSAERFFFNIFKFTHGQTPTSPNFVWVRSCAMSKREWSASDQIQRHGDEAICSCPVLCLVGDGGNPTSHGVCRHIDERGIDGDSISRGVGGLDDNIGLMATRSAAALAASNDVFIRSIRLYPRGRKSLVNTWLKLQKTSKKGISSIGFRDCVLTMKSLLLLARGVLRD